MTCPKSDILIKSAHKIALVFKNVHGADCVVIAGVAVRSSCLTSIVAVEEQGSRITQPDEAMQGKKDGL